MDNIVTKGARQVRNKFLANIVSSLTRIENELDHLDAKIDAIHGLEQTSMREINERINNSGTIRISDTEIIAKIFSGIKIFLDPKDISVTPHLALDHIWEDTATYAWLDVIKPGNTIFDIGANFGYFGAIAAQYAGRKSRVVLFEPNSHLIPYINKTLSVNWLKEQSMVENVAVSDKDGKAELSVLKDYIGSSSLHASKELNEYMHNKMHIETQEKISVPTVSLDSYCKLHKINKVDLIKMDIEGFEDRAYEGMRGIVDASPKLTLFVEFTKEGYKQPEEFYEQMLKDFGNLYLIDEHGKIVRPKKDDYKSVIGGVDDWAMLIFSKDARLSHS